MPETNKCIRCKKKLSIALFRKRKRKLISGEIKEYYESTCKSCEGKAVNECQKKRFKLMKQNDPQGYKAYLKAHHPYNRASKRKSINELSVAYVAFLLGMKKREALKYPLLIEAKRAQIKLHRKANPNHKNIKQ